MNNTDPSPARWSIVADHSGGGIAYRCEIDGTRFEARQGATGSWHLLDDGDQMAGPFYHARDARRQVVSIA